ncbi:glycerophosphodiester phosphodiesterase [Paenibacillus kribbensis]|uniref:glycerophosphodiester phosphodiesterase n=1 Tax=Paenibacillus kribbensis TaxID=172713 RepID=UPI00083866EE|nr:glycerophosphodiester phosphodiesterase [Paenibacillus kribbensis]
MTMTEKVINFAHRGASGVCPENTMAAFRHALELGATGIETDVQRTQDGYLVLIHDESLKRTAGSPLDVRDITLQELNALDAGGWFDEKFRGERVPLLDELLELAQSSDTVINLELKNSIYRYPGMEEEVIAAVKRFGLEERVILSSFNHESLALCAQLAPEIRTGALYIEVMVRPSEYAAQFGVTALHAYKHAVTPEAVSEALAAGVVYHPWTVNEPEEMKYLLEAGVSGIITDYPDRLVHILASRSS